MAVDRWTDDRLDDLAAMVRSNDHRLDKVQDMAQTNERDIRDLMKSMDIKARNRLEKAMIAAALASPIVTVIALLVHHG